LKNIEVFLKYRKLIKDKNDIEYIWITKITMIIINNAVV
tara:strand:- start:162 stop:278 length:117 start_codon:yes stop_codon:yes gene_type:complete